LVRAEWLAEHQAQIIKELMKNEGRYQGDAPADSLRSKINDLKALFLARFPIAMTKRLAKAFYNRMSTYNAAKVGSAFKTAGVDLKDALARENLSDFAGVAIQNQVDLIKSIDEEYFSKIEKIIYNGMLAGSDYETLATKIQEATGATRKRAKFIARDQSASVNGMLSKKRAEAVGITKGIWIKSKFTKTKNYTPRKSHIEADGKVFELSKGLKVDGEYIFPSQEINCTCSYGFVVD
jgi:uncharacterized protein with gpF-like domain